MARSLSGAQSSDGGGSNVCTGSHTTTKTTVRNTSSPPIPATHGVISIFSGGCGDQPLGACDSFVSTGPGSSDMSQPALGGAITSASRIVSRRRRSCVSLTMVIAMLTICTMPEITIIAPKIPRAM